MIVLSCGNGATLSKEIEYNVETIENEIFKMISENYKNLGIRLKINEEKKVGFPEIVSLEKKSISEFCLTFIRENGIKDVLLFHLTVTPKE
jgi:hypothetical protein